MLLLQVFILSLIFGISMDMKANIYNISKLRLGSVYHPLSLVKIDNNTATKLFKHVNIMMAGDETEVVAATNYFNTIPEGFLVANIKGLEHQDKSLKIVTPVDQPIELPAIKREELQDEMKAYTHNFSSDQIVMIYCTHNGETYIPNSGKARLDGKRGLINDVAENLSEQIKSRGLNADFIDTIHDFPEFSKSYANSRDTVKEIIDKNKDKNLAAILDVHRDSIPGSNNAETIKVNGKKTARVLIIVGTDERKPHPNWKENLSFAEKLQEEGEKMYPGLIKGVRTKAGTYNQEYHERALLLEFGNDHNSLEEVKYATELFADILIEVLKKEVD